MSDIQVPSFSTVATSNQLINNCIGLVQGANNSANATAAVSGNTNMTYYENNMVPSTLSNPGTNTNSSFDSDTNFDSNSAKYLNQTYSPTLPQFQTGANMMLPHGPADSFSSSNTNSPSMMTYGNGGGVGMLGSNPMMNHLSENSGTMNSNIVVQPVTPVSSSSSER